MNDEKGPIRQSNENYAKELSEGISWAESTGLSKTD